MYAVINGNRYNNIQGKFRNSIVYTGESLTGIESVSGKISCYADDGFLNREDNVADYLRTIISEGRIELTNIPEPEPPEPPTPEPDMWDEMANAIKEGVNSVD